MDTSLGEMISRFVMQKNYPCTAAIQSVARNESIYGQFENFGSGQSGRQLRAELQKFIQQQQANNSTYLSYWAIYEGQNLFSEDDFEIALWQELSHLTSEQTKNQDWKDLAKANPTEKSFSFCIDGHEFFVVGLHPQSSRLARRFPKPAIVFNVFKQFENLEKSGQYESIKKLIRERDVRLQGSVNPMVENYGDQWEAIQFSGKKNESQWKCPFHFIKDLKNRLSDQNA